MRKYPIPRIIRGAGGGDSPSQHTPVEAADTLQSSASAQILDLVAEGEIEGLANGLKSIYLDGTPIQNSDGTFNFAGLVVDTRVGTQAQDYIPGASDAENEISVAVEVKNGSPGPIIRSVTNANVDAVRVLLSFPQLSSTNASTGDVSGTSVNYAIDVQANGAGYVEIVNHTIYGKSMSKYERSYRIPLAGTPPYDIRVRRISPDETTVNNQNRTVWESYAEIEDVKLAYPNSALVGIRVKASQFSSIPTRAYDLKLLKIHVPTNYNPVTRVYTGSWDGTFKIAWTDNPAWIFYDLVTSTRYGLGGFIPADQVDKWTLYSVGKYCDQLVPNGFGGTEPRFTCNLYLQTRAEAFKVINDLASIFRSMAYWAGGALTVSQDSPQDAVYLFTPTNVINGLFNYVGASAKARHTVALVTWNNPADFYSQKVEYVEDADAIAIFGVVETQVVAMGCTSRGQAHRLGRWILLTERYQSETVGFQTGLEGATLRPGQIIKIADPVRAGIRRGGRVSSATTTQITIDDSTFVYSPGLSISVIQPDNSIEERAIQSIASGVVTLVTPLSQAPQAQAIWLISDSVIEPQQYRVIAVIENKEGLFEVTALAHNPSKFDTIDLGTTLEIQNISVLNATPDSPTDLLVTETLYAVGADVRTKITLSWRPVTTASSYIVQWRRDSQNVITMPETSSNDIEILSAEPGLYDFWVYAISAVGKRSVPSTASQTIIGKAAPPSNVQNFSLIPQAGMAYLTWDQATDLDVLIGGSIRIRYSPDLLTPDWNDAVDIMPALAGTSTHASAPLLVGSYMAKFVDSTGHPSVSESILETTIPVALDLNVVQTINEDPLWAGAKTNMEYRADFASIAITSSTLIDALTDIDSILSFDFLGGVEASGEYDFATAVNLGAIYTSRVTAGITTEGIDITDSIDQRLDNVDDWPNADGDVIDVNATLYMRTTEGDPSGSPTWTDWKPFFVGEYKARGMQFKVLATSGNVSHTILIKNLSVTIDMPDRTVNMPALVSGVGTYNVVYFANFAAIPAIGITAHNMNSGDYYVIASKTNSGFSITFYNSSAAIVSRTFDVIAKGYGRAS